MFLIFAVLSPLFSYASNESILEQIKKGAVQSASSSLVVIQNNRTVFSYFKDGSDHVQNIQSVSKSITALGIEILLDQSKISSLDLPMSTWIPQWSYDLQKSKITLRMILNHTAGFSGDHQTCYSGKILDVIANCETMDLVATPGIQFIYSSSGSTLLQSVIAQASGQTVTDFFNRNLFLPLGIGSKTWIKDPSGHELVAGGLRLNTSDMIIIGQLILNRGSLNGKRILSQSAANDLMTKSQPFADYGLLWWLEQPGAGPKLNSNPSQPKIFYAYGYGGQFIIIWPEKNLIIVRTRDPKTLVVNPLTTQQEWDTEQFYSLLTLASEWN